MNDFRLQFDVPASRLFGDELLSSLGCGFLQLFKTPIGEQPPATHQFSVVSLLLFKLVLDHQFAVRV
jgi:hypothetical protein